MAKRLWSSVILKSNSYLTKSNIDKCDTSLLGKHRKLSTTAAQVPVKEITIPTQWGGHIAGKLWGNEHEQPILAVHGWQDNAGTWDPLAPALSQKRPILAIDFPGHGLSSWYPKGVHYAPWDFARLILYIKDYFKWDKVPLLGHSMGSIAAMRFASVFPDEVAFYIAIDSLIYDDYDLNSVVENFPKILRKIEVAQTRLDTQPPCYTEEEMTKIWHLSTNKSVALESVRHLAKRGTKQSPTEPNKYYFSRDPRLKTVLFCPENQRVTRALVTRLKCPTLYIKGKESPYAVCEYSVELRKLIAEHNSNFEFHNVTGTHHLHLNDPERILPLIIDFLKRHKFITE